MTHTRYAFIKANWHAEIVNRAGYASPVRTPRGRDIMAACGQLKSASVKERASARMAAMRSAELARMPQ